MCIQQLYYTYDTRIMIMLYTIIYYGVKHWGTCSAVEGIVTAVADTHYSCSDVILSFCGYTRDCLKLIILTTAAAAGAIFFS